MKTSLKRRDYRSYIWKRGEWFWVSLQSVAIVIALAYFFYRSLSAAIPLSPVGVIYFRMQKQQRAKRCREELVTQFKECSLSVVASLRAGYAVENAFMESREDMRMLYGEQSLIYQELELVRRGLVINITLEELLSDLAERSCSEEICQFAEIFAIAKRNGGSLVEVLHTSAEMIGQRIDVKQELRIMLSGRQMEQKVMKCMPFGILIYVGSSHRGYFDILYHNWQGAAVMTGCLGLYLGAYILCGRILQNMEEELVV